MRRLGISETLHDWRKAHPRADGSEITPTSKPQPHGMLVKALARAWRWQRMLKEGQFASVRELAEAERVSLGYYQPHSAPDPARPGHRRANPGRAADRRPSGAVDWVNESFAIARKPSVGYCVMVGDTCHYAADNREFDEGEPERVVVVDDGYLDRHAAIARERIAMAGFAGARLGELMERLAGAGFRVRLAGLLNRALGDQRPEHRADRSDTRAPFRSAP